MKDAAPESYFRELTSAFGPSSHSPVYQRLLRNLAKIHPLHVLTTNVDETLERNLDSTVTVQFSDIERICGLVQSKQSFICKLHGTSSAAESMVFTEDDYSRLIGRASYLAAIRELFSLATVVFVGYSLRDEYLVKLLLESESNHPLFGTGPHYLITANERKDIPSSVKQIRYESEFADHRDSLLALEVMAEAISSSNQTALNAEAPHHRPITPRAKSVYYLADLLPPVGEIQTSQTATFSDADGNSKGQFMVGEGYVQSEIQISGYSALHDLIVGLLCFDSVCFDANRISTIHNLLGSDIFWALVQSEALRVVHIAGSTVVLFSDERSAIGTLAEVSMGDRDNGNGPEVPITLSAVIRKHLLPVPGNEKIAEELFEKLSQSAICISSRDMKHPFSEQTRRALVRPSIRDLIGMSRGTPYGTIPRWLVFPALRLAKVVAIGTICRSIDASAARMILGIESLATAAFSSEQGKCWADESASYVLTGRFNSDLGKVVLSTPALLHRLIDFRSSSLGETFRKEIAESLQTDKGGEVAAAVNAGLKQALSASVMEQARNQFSGLFIATGASSVMPAVWGDLENGAKRIGKWRDRSRGILQEEIAKNKLSPYSSCPCGSGEQLKFCCLAALR